MKSFVLSKELGGFEFIDICAGTYSISRCLDTPKERRPFEPGRCWRRDWYRCTGSDVMRVVASLITCGSRWESGRSPKVNCLKSELFLESGSLQIDFRRHFLWALWSFDLCWNLQYLFSNLVTHYGKLLGYRISFYFHLLFATIIPNSMPCVAVSWSNGRRQREIAAVGLRTLWKAMIPVALLEQTWANM